MSSPEESEDKESQETQFMAESPNTGEFEESMELKLTDTQTEEDMDASKNDSFRPPSEGGKFAAPSRLSLHTTTSSTDEKHYMTATQNTIMLSESEDTFSKSGSKNSPDFENTSNLSPAVLTPLSDDTKPSLGSQDVFTLSVRSTASTQLLSQKAYEPFSSSTPRLRSSSSDTDSPALKKPKLDPDPDSSVEIIPKTPDSSTSGVFKADLSADEVSTDRPALPLSTQPNTNSQNSGNTIILDSANTCVSAPDLTLHYTQSASQVKELANVDASKRPSNGTATHNSSEDSLKTSWGSHNYEDFSYHSHGELRKSPSKRLKEPHPTGLEDTFTCDSGPLKVVLKQVYSSSRKLVALEIVSFSIHLVDGKEYRRCSSSLSSGALADNSSGSSSLYSIPGPFPLQPRFQKNVSSSDSDPRPLRAKVHMVNGNKIFHSTKLSPGLSFEKVPVRCSNCLHEFPTPRLFSPSSLNGTTNGKGELYANSTGRIDTPDMSSGSPGPRGHENRLSPASPVSYHEIIRSQEEPLTYHTIALGFYGNAYFPCRILSNVGDKYAVSFLDIGGEKELTKNKLIPLSMLVPSSKLKVQVAPNAQSYTAGQLDRISDLPEHRAAPFVVQIENEFRNFPVEALCLNEQQRKALIKMNNPPPAANLSSVDLDNCLSAKRTRTPRQSIISSITSPRTGKPTTAKKLFRSAECKASTSEGKTPRHGKKSVRKLLDEPKSYSSDTESDPKHYELDLSGNGIRGVHLEKKNLNDPLRDLKQKNITSANDDQNLIKQYGPIPVKGSNLFSSYVFVLSYSDELPSRTSFQIESSTGSETEVDEFDVKHPPFSKSRLITQIKAGGGAYYENITDVPFNELKNTVLISNKPSLTCTYIYALAEGIRAYGHHSIIECCVKSTRFSDYVQNHNYLPNGWSYTLKGYKEVLKKRPTDDSLRPRVFKDKWILLLLDEKTKKECIDFWTAILDIAGAKVRRGYAKVGSDDSPVYAIADETVGKEYRDKKDVKCVSVVWLIQSLINNTLVKAENHPHYKYDFRPGRADDSV